MEFWVVRFVYKATEKSFPLTKRGFLRFLSSIFDLLGLIAPFLIR